jgi:3-oxoacyl-[acyl-carrier protein] reductase
MDLGLKGRTAVVLAASGGIGRACAEALAEEGARLAICARGPEALEAAAAELSKRTEVFSAVCDVTDPLHAASFIQQVERRFGRIDVLVNNCGGPKPGGFFAELTEEDWSQAFERCLMQVARWTKAVTPGMMERRWGRIVNIVSTSVRQPIDALLLSNALRPGVLGYTTTAARALAPHNVTMNSLLPGTILTERTNEQARAAGVPEAEFYKKKAADVPMGRLGRAREVGDVVAFLCSERASYVTGTSVTVDGGLVRALY